MPNLYGPNQYMDFDYDLRREAETLKRAISDLSSCVVPVCEAYLESKTPDFNYSKADALLRATTLRANGPLSTDLRSALNSLEYLSEIRAAYAKRAAPSSPEELAPNDGIVTVWQDRSQLIISTPLYHKATPGERPALFKDSVLSALREADNHTPSAAKFRSTGPFDMYMAMVYPKAVSPAVVADCDNMDTKAVADAAFLFLGQDDNALSVHWHLMGLRTDEVDTGAYVILRKRRKCNILGENEILKILRAKQNSIS